MLNSGLPILYGQSPILLQDLFAWLELAEAFVLRQHFADTPSKEAFCIRAYILSYPRQLSNYSRAAKTCPLPSARIGASMVVPDAPRDGA